MTGERGLGADELIAVTISYRFVVTNNHREYQSSTTEVLIPALPGFRFTVGYNPNLEVDLDALRRAIVNYLNWLAEKED